MKRMQDEIELRYNTLTPKEAKRYAIIGAWGVLTIIGLTVYIVIW